MVNGYSSEWLGKGFDWVYPNEIIARKGRTGSGDTVDIVAQDGRHLGVGIASDGKVAVRRFREDKGGVDAVLVASRLAEARARRRLPVGTTAWRWLHGENDGMPGFRVDVWGSQATIAVDHPSLMGLLGAVVDAVASEPGIDTVWRATRPEHEDGLSGHGEGECLFGDDVREEVVVLEDGLKYSVAPWMGLDAGLYPDMRAVRQWLQPHWKGRRVLNTFAYTGAFFIAAAAGGAKSVDTVDLAAPAVARAKRNFAINDLEGDEFSFWTEDTFAALDRFRRAGQVFDLIVVDPPSFAHGPSGVWSIEQGLTRVVSGCLRVMAPGGWILVATNQGSMSPKEFQKHIKAASLKVGRRLRLIHQGSPPHDVPAALDFPESRYLKAWVLEG
jgi:23S rRNA (cytosine1962-C5)-methyltransferase